MSTTTTTTRNREIEAAKTRVLNLIRKSAELYPRDAGREDNTSLAAFVLKADDAVEKKEMTSKQGVTFGRLAHPFNYRRVKDLKRLNPHHSACLDAKKQSTMGMGFKNEQTTKALAPLGRVFSFTASLVQAVEDYWTVGGGLLECLRNEKQELIAAHYLPAEDAHIYIESDGVSSHWEIDQTAGVTRTRAFANFGDRESFIERSKVSGSGIPREDAQNPSEVIYLPQPSALSRLYGYPDWLAATPSIELGQAIRQQQFDFFINRGVPEFFLFVLGGTVGAKDWRKIENALQATIGPGNQGKSIACNLVGEGLKVQLEKLGMEGKTDGGAFSDQSQTLALDITSAHRTPPLIAGIQVPGKMGATNEAMNAIWSFQLLTIGPAQTIIKEVFKNTLGRPKTEGGLGLDAQDAFDFQTLTDVMDLGLGGTVDTMSRMREEAPEAKAKGRKLEDGLKKQLEKMDEEQLGKFIGGVILALTSKAA